MFSVEDVANLTASDVMNRVNLGYLQGNSPPWESSFDSALNVIANMPTGPSHLTHSQPQTNACMVSACA